MKLQEMIKTRRENSKDKDEIDFLAQLSAEADSEGKAFEELSKKHEEVRKDYREVVLHTTFPKKDKEPREDTPAKPKTFDEIFTAHFGQGK